MAAIHHEHDRQSIRGFTLAGKHLFGRLMVAGVLALVFACESWGQISTGAPKEPPNLTPLPHPDIAKPAMLELGPSLWIIIPAVIGLLVVLVLFVWLLFRKRPAIMAPQIPPLKQALERMESLRAQVEQLPPPEVAHRVSVILRDYQFGRYALPAPFRTSEELYGDPSTMNREELRQRFAPISAIYDRIEFAPALATKVESLDLIEAAIEALHEEKRYQDAPAPNPVPSSRPLAESAASPSP
jgi:hypothetical protein